MSKNKENEALKTLKEHMNRVHNTSSSSKISNIKQYVDGEISAKQVGLRIFSIRKTLNITQESMSEALNISPSGLRRLESGNAFPSGPTLIMLHEVYGVDLLWLLYGTHSLRMDILNAIASSSDDIKFDVFTRLYSYFTTRDPRSFLISNSQMGNVEHFAKWNHSTYYMPIDEEETCDEKEYHAGDSFDVDFEDYINTYYPDAPEHLSVLIELLKK